MSSLTFSSHEYFWVGKHRPQKYKKNILGRTCLEIRTDAKVSERKEGE